MVVLKELELDKNIDNKKLATEICRRKRFLERVWQMRDRGIWETRFGTILISVPTKKLGTHSSPGECFCEAQLNATLRPSSPDLVEFDLIRREQLLEQVYDLAEGNVKFLKQ